MDKGMTLPRLQNAIRWKIEQKTQADGSAKLAKMMARQRILIDQRHRK